MQRDWTDGKVVYKIYFSGGTVCGNYVIDATTGEILKYSRVDEDRRVEISENVIGENTARIYALAKNGLVDGNVSKYNMTLAQVEDQYIYILWNISATAGAIEQQSVPTTEPYLKTKRKTYTIQAHPRSKRREVDLRRNDFSII